MFKKLVLVIIGLLVLGIVAAALGLAWAHQTIREQRAALPPRMWVALAPAGLQEHPVRLSFINTASQVMPRSAVLDAAHDPHPDAPYIMSHPSFVLEWADGRILLVDVGMTREGARVFGRPIEWLSGGQPIQPLTSVAERLGEARTNVQGIIFTHLHSDHVGGITELCKGLHHPIRVFMTRAQAEDPNYTTRGGLQLVRDSGCAQIELLEPRSLMLVPGFDGAFVIAAGGHTPGSQIVTTVVASEKNAQGYAFIGDIVNNLDGITYNIPKPFFYSLLVVPEDWKRLGELRRYLKDLRSNGFKLLAAHDQLQLEGSGVPEWRPPAE